MIRNKHWHVLFITLIITLSACKSDHPVEGHGNLNRSNLMASEVATGIEVGQRAPDISLTSPEGKEIALSSLRGKIVLIDFWASWCMPCRIENPNLVNVYKKYNNRKFTRGKGFTIYSVSLDNDMESWKKGIENDGLAWEYHVSDLQGWNAAPAALYKVVAIPANFLVDGDGVIIAKNLRAEALGETMESLMR
jgi:thiol-disulfide isomerase/thioredoxin